MSTPGDRGHRLHIDFTAATILPAPVSRRSRASGFAQWGTRRLCLSKGSHIIKRQPPGTDAAISAAMPPNRGASSTTNAWLVSLTEDSSVSRSRGCRVLRSITSASMPTSWR
jgi:hypothetical protein